MCFHMNRKGCGPFNFCNYSSCENQRGFYCITYNMFTITQLIYSIKVPHAELQPLSRPVAIFPQTLALVNSTVPGEIFHINSIIPETG